MTAWTPIIVLLSIMAICTVDIVGMEYGNSNQPFTDQQLKIWIALSICWAMLMDIINFIKGVYRK